MVAGVASPTILASTVAQTVIYSGQASGDDSFQEQRSDYKNPHLPSEKKQKQEQVCIDSTSL